MKTLIIDKLTNEYYCVETTEAARNAQLTTGPDDFPYWSTDVNEACDFGGELFATHELQLNDLTVDGTRQPEIISI